MFFTQKSIDNYKRAFCKKAADAILVIEWGRVPDRKKLSEIDNVLVEDGVNETFVHWISNPMKPQSIANDYGLSKEEKQKFLSQLSENKMYSGIDRGSMSTENIRRLLKKFNGRLRTISTNVNYRMDMGMNQQQVDNWERARRLGPRRS